jgi:hypothetical protein
VLGDRWDSKGQLWKTLWVIPVVMPEFPMTVSMNFGYYDLTSGAWYSADMYNQKQEQYKQTARWPDRMFTPDALASESVR